MEHAFSETGFSLGVEEELMILDGSSLDLRSAIESLLEDSESEVKPELMESILEIATPPCRDAAEVAAELQRLRADAAARAAQKGLAIGSAGTHAFARWEDQRIVGRDRYRGLAAELGFVVRQEIVFGMHVHVGVAEPEQAIHVANGLRVQIPLLVALGANSPFWRGDDSGLQSSRVPIFRALPRVGIPPRYEGWQDFQRRVQRMVDSGLIDDYTYLWYDVRPHPRLGTVEIRAIDAQTRLEHTVALTALVQCLVHALSAEFAAGASAPLTHSEVLDVNKWLAARHGLDAQLLDPDRSSSSSQRRSVRELAEEQLTRLAPNAEQLGCSAELAQLRELLEGGTGADRQRVVYGANGDLREVVAEIVAST